MSETPRSHRTIKALVFDHVRRKNGLVNYDELTGEVLEQFPHSQWKRTHWAWYRYQITRGRFKDQFSEDIRANIRSLARAPRTPRRPPPPEEDRGAAGAKLRRGPRPKDPLVKQLGDPILKSARDAIQAAAGDDPDLRFKLNRWVYARLMQHEIRTKRRIKKELWERGMRACQACRQPFTTLRGVELHRKDSSLGYSIENCEFLCRDCHRQLDC